VATHWRRSGRPEQPLPPSITAATLTELFDTLTDAPTWRRGRQPLPLIVLEPEGPRQQAGPEGPGRPDGPGGGITAAVEHLQKVASSVGVRYAAPPLDDRASAPNRPTTPEDPVLRLLDRLCDPVSWRGSRTQFGGYRFPHSRLVASLTATEGSGLPGDEVGPRLRAQEFACPGSDPARTWPRVLATVGVVAGAAGVPSLGVAYLADRLADVPTAVLAPVFFTVLAGLAMVPALRFRLAATFGFGSRYRWFARTRSLAFLDTHSLYDRARALRDHASGPLGAQDVVRVRAAALLEDMRFNHRRLSLTFRGFKRTAPPALFLRPVTEANGGAGLLRALSDVRTGTGRSDPLLVVAAAPQPLDWECPSGEATLSEQTSPALARYRSWRAALPSSVTPGSGVRYPWVLLMRVPSPLLGPASWAGPTVAFRRRPRYSWLLSLPAAGAAGVVVCGFVAWDYAQRDAEYCDAGLFHTNRLALRKGPPGHQVCVGVISAVDSRSAAPLPRDAAQVRLDESGVPAGAGVLAGTGAGTSVSAAGPPAEPGSPAGPAGLETLADLMAAVDAENARVTASGSPYVDVAYLGILSLAPGDAPDRLRYSARGLAGAYLAQQRNNSGDAVNRPLKVRLLVADAGPRMEHQVDAVDRITWLAESRRPDQVKIVGVVGMGRNTLTTRAAVKRLALPAPGGAADPVTRDRRPIPVVASTNSSDRLPWEFPHYFHVAATNADEAAAARRLVAQLVEAGRAHRVAVFYGGPDPHDQYSIELARDFRTALDEVRNNRRLPVRLVGERGPYTDGADLDAKVQRVCRSSPSTRPDVVYYAGRGRSCDPCCGV
jgi:hypothetical protein